ncbi:MAG: glycosyltransferase family 4 protein [Bacillus sp. (in: firmicutes)]
MRKRILMISQNFYPELGSAGNRMKNIYQLLRQRGYDVTVLTTEPSYPNRHIYEDDCFWTEEELNDNDRIHRVRVSNRKYSFSMLNRLLFYLEFTIRMLWAVVKDRNKYDAVFATSPAIFIGFVGMFAKLRFRTKLILDIRDLWPESLNGVGVFNHPIILKSFYMLEILLYKSANHIIVNSEGFIGHIKTKGKVDGSKILYLPNAARLFELPIGKTENDTFRVIYTGNVGLAQDVSFLKEFSLKMNRQQIPLNIVGYGVKKNELVEFVKEKQLENVRFLHPVKRSECLDMNARHEVGILSLNSNSVFDTVLPGKLIDYMISGLPVVGAVSGNAKRIIEKHHTGFVSEKRNVDEIIDYINNLKENSLLRREMARNSMKLIKQEFLWESNIHSLFDVIEAGRYLKMPLPVKSQTGKVESK